MKSAGGVTRIDHFTDSMAIADPSGYRAACEVVLELLEQRSEADKARFRTRHKQMTA